jgi:phospholipid/cholesterol/gamma-HCH transport system substrate-binding protein
LDSLLKEVAENVNKVSAQSQKIFNEKNAQYIQDFLSNIDNVSKVIANSSSNINSGIKNMDVFLTNLAKVSKEFPETMKDLKKGVNKFNGLASDMSAASKSVSQTMVSGKNAIDQISQQAVPSATYLLHRLNAISANLEKVSNELRQDPSVVIRGTKPPKPGPGE